MLLVLCETALLGYLHENVTTIKLPNLDQTPLYFVMALVSRDVAGIPCLVQPGQEGVQRKGKKRTQRRLDCTIITFLLNIWRTLMSESPVPSQYLDTKATIAASPLVHVPLEE